VLHLVHLDDKTVNLIPFNNAEFILEGPAGNLSGLLKGAVKLTELEWKRRVVAFLAWEGTKDQDDNQPEKYTTDFESYWKVAPEETVNSFFNIQNPDGIEYGGSIELSDDFEMTMENPLTGEKKVMKEGVDYESS